MLRFALRLLANVWSIFLQTNDKSSKRERASKQTQSLYSEKNNGIATGQKPTPVLQSISLSKWLMGWTPGIVPRKMMCDTTEFAATEVIDCNCIHFLDLFGWF